MRSSTHLLLSLFGRSRYNLSRCVVMKAVGEFDMWLMKKASEGYSGFSESLFLAVQQRVAYSLKGGGHGGVVLKKKDPVQAIFFFVLLYTFRKLFFCNRIFIHIVVLIYSTVLYKAHSLLWIIIIINSKYMMLYKPAEHFSRFIASSCCTL